MASSRFDPQPPDRSTRGSQRDYGMSDTRRPAVDGEPENVDLLAIIARAENISRDYQTKTVDRPLARAYRAWQSQHAEGSKYLTPAFKNVRSGLFVPKTRAAVRKNLAAAAGALFSTEDVTSVAATFEDDVQQRATAAVIKADLEYRLSRTSARSGLPWFQLAMGACLDSQITGVCFSKQFWEYEEVETGEIEVTTTPLIDPLTGDVMIGPDGIEITVETETPIMRVTKDRPMVEVHALENVGIDPAAPWHSPVQGGRWFTCRYPMGLSDARAMIASADKRGNNTWLPVSDELLMKGRIEEERGGARRVREAGGDRYEDATRAGGELDIVWIQENFVRVGGKDYHFWSVGRHGFLSIVQETHEAYPELGGERPYVMGVAQLDTHRVFPQSPVESWQPLQMELNDITNLRLDTLKRAISPLAVARRGKNVDMQALQRRGQPDTVLMVDSLDDVSIVSTPGPNGAAFQETSITNSNFDELAGVFSTSSVQQSRQLNETVGGMSLMSRAANSVSEFDLRIWIETWVEPVLRHLVHLVRYHESDEKILAIAGQQARVWTRYQYMPSIDDFDQCEMTVRVNAGIGSADPIQKLQKLKFAFEMLGPILPEAKAKGISLNVETIIEEVMGQAGFRDGRRFFDYGDPAEPEPGPDMVKIMKDFEARMAKVEVDRERFARDAQVKLEAIRSGERQSAADNDAVISSSEIEWLGRLAQQTMGQASGDMRQATTLRAKEAEAAERYRVQQLQQQAQQNFSNGVANNVANNEMLPQIQQVLQGLIRQVGALSEQVQAQQQAIGAMFGRVPGGLSAMVQ